MVPAVFIYNLDPPELSGSILLQALIPARHIGAKALYFGPGMDAEAFLDRHKPGALIITKIFNDSPIALAEAAHRRGIKIVGVFCDINSRLEERNTKLAPYLSAAVAPTQAGVKLVESYLAMSCRMIEEPVTVPRKDVRFAPGPALQVLWFGHGTNHDTLHPGMQAIVGYRKPVTFRIVSNVQPDWQGMPQAPNVKVVFHAWSPLMLVQCLAQADVVLLPSFDREDKFAKGQSRLVDAIQYGRVAIAHPLPQYQELSDFCFCSRDYLGVLEYAVSHPQEAIKRVEAGQRYIAERFSADACSDKWAQLIANL
jgi:hypothetical protein